MILGHQVRGLIDIGRKICKRRHLPWGLGLEHFVSCVSVWVWAWQVSQVSQVSLHKSCFQPDFNPKDYKGRSEFVGASDAGKAQSILPFWLWCASQTTQETECKILQIEFEPWLYPILIPKGSKSTDRNNYNIFVAAVIMQRISLLAAISCCFWRVQAGCRLPSGVCLFLFMAAFSSMTGYMVWRNDKKRWFKRHCC